MITTRCFNCLKTPICWWPGLAVWALCRVTIMVIIIVIMTIMVPTVTNDDFSPLHTQLPSWQGLPAARCLSPKNRVHPKTWSKSKWLWLGRNDQPHLTDQWTTPISFASIFPLFPPGANKTLCWGFITNIPTIALDFLIMFRNRVKKEVFSKPRLLQSWFALIVVQHWNVHLEMIVEWNITDNHDHHILIIISWSSCHDDKTSLSTGW